MKLGSKFSLEEKEKEKGGKRIDGVVVVVVVGEQHMSGRGSTAVLKIMKKKESKCWSQENEKEKGGNKKHTVVEEACRS